MHIGTDTWDPVYSVVVIDAATHDSVILDDLVHGEQEVIYDDKAYAAQVHQNDHKNRGVEWCVSRKARRDRKLNCPDRSFNKKSNRTRPRVKHAFGVVKHLWGYHQVCYRGLDKNSAQVFTLFVLSHFYLARHESAAL